MRYAAAAILLLIMSLTAAANPGQADPLGGAKKPVPDMNLARTGQFKRVHQLALRYILLDRCDEAASFLEEHVKDHPSEEESYYVLAALHARTGDREKAVATFKKAIDLGLPPERIIAGPRELTEPLSDHAFYRELVREYATRPVHGPLVGNVTDRSASVWVRTAKEASVTVLIGEEMDSADPRRSDPARSTKQNDYTAVAKINGLRPDTVYHYAIQIDDGPTVQLPHQHFRTFPKYGSPAKFALAFGGGAGYVPANERMWDTINSFDPLALLLLGDNVYIDDPESETMQRYTYYRRQSRPEWRRLTAGTAVFSIWDDHDFSVNDSWGGPRVDVPAWKRRSSWPIFVQNWANPAYGRGEARPGCWYTFSIADVDFIMLDCRYYRTDPGSRDPSMLGPHQLEWFKDALQTATGTFKVLCSSVPWDFRTKGDSLDTWNGYRAEREKIFGFIERQKIEGVILMSADRHRSDAWRIERPGGYDFLEFNSSRLTNQHVHATVEKKGALFSYNKKQSFGLVTFDTTASDPQVTYDVVTIDGETVHSLKVRRSQLRRE